MIVARGLAGVRRDPASVVTVGTFDGVHRAHRAIIAELVSRARLRGGRSVVITFDPHPRQVVGNRGEPVRLLTTIGERIALLGSLGIDLLVVLPFTTEFSRLTPREFFTEFVVNGTGVSDVVVGYDHMFGRDRQAGTGELMWLGREFDFSVFTLRPFTLDGQTVSSTAIRRVLDTGDVRKAAGLLGYRYTLGGTVVRGDGRGKGLGFPTANIVPEEAVKLVPARGVYAAAVTHRGVERGGMVNIGVRPTVSSSGGVFIEAHLFGFSGELYGEEVALSFHDRLRDERKFASLEELKAQLGRDREASLAVLGQRQT